jgi:flagellar assembly protein FliH
MSSNWAETKGVVPAPIRALVYLDTSSRPTMADFTRQMQAPATEKEAERRRFDVELSDEEFGRRIGTERADATQLAEERLRREYEQRLEAERAPILSAVHGFEAQREEYFGRAEAEIVQLSLAIAAKILHREAQVDPMLLATLVRMAVEKMREGSSVTLRVGAGEIKEWNRYFAQHATGAEVQIVEDDALSRQDCLLETELGTANFGLDTQLKEVEQGFFDLMALRPVKG